MSWMYCSTAGRYTEYMRDMWYSTFMCSSSSGWLVSSSCSCSFRKRDSNSSSCSRDGNSSSWLPRRYESSTSISAFVSVFIFSESTDATLLHVSLAIFSFFATTLFLDSTTHKSCGRTHSLAARVSSASGNTLVSASTSCGSSSEYSSQNRSRLFFAIFSSSSSRKLFQLSSSSLRQRTMSPLSCWL